MFQIGQSVVHPAYGAGTVIDIARRSIGDLNNRYYIIAILDETRSSQVMVPVRRADEFGLRPVGHPSDLVQVIEECEAVYEDGYDTNYRQRIAEETELCKCGDFVVLASLVRRLTYMHHRRPLGNSERDLLANAKDRLVSELALSTGWDVDQASDTLAEALGEMLDRCEEAAKD